MRDNPFAPLPTTPTGGGGETGVLSRDGKWIVKPLTATWPERCVVCNASVPASDFNAKLTWTPRWVIFVFLVSRLIGLILFFVKRKTINLHVGLCEAHRGARRTKMWIGGGVMAAAMMFGGAGIALNAGALIGLGGLTFLGGIVVMALGAMVVKAHKVEGDLAWVTAGQAFTDSIG
jgi:hypothetical protein